MTPKTSVMIALPNQLLDAVRRPSSNVYPPKAPAGPSGATGAVMIVNEAAESARNSARTI